MAIHRLCSGACTPITGYSDRNGYRIGRAGIRHIKGTLHGIGQDQRHDLGSLSTAQAARLISQLITVSLDPPG
ncbi:hypothetical protein ACFL51_00655 [Myxococcota bacterium]